MNLLHLPFQIIFFSLSHSALRPGKLNSTDYGTQLPCPLASNRGPLMGSPSRRSQKGGRRGWNVYAPSSLLAEPEPWFGSGLPPKAIAVRQLPARIVALCVPVTAPSPCTFRTLTVPTPQVLPSLVSPPNSAQIFVNRFFIKLF